MQSIRVRDKNQITLPIAIVQAAKIRSNDTLEIAYQDGVIMLMTKSATNKKKKSIMDFAGIAKGLWGNSTEEVHKYIADERAAWER